ncbi:MAG: alpha-glucosidase [Bacilli bacterium]|nr:alpha-glucosidase [Bacilli bacterium]
MKQSKWFKDAFVYQIYPMSFCDGNGDGIGDIPGIISKLDHLKDLGINCVWLSPVYVSPMEDNGYDIADYYNINPMFGTLDDFKEMVKGMHERGIRLIMDLVMNHTSNEHKWFKEACKSKDNPYRDYYIWKDGKGKNGKKPPNNWTGFFGEKAWKYHAETDSWYLHLFADGQPDVNWENPKVREEFKNVIKYWCDLGVDGFRCDVINLISKDQRFADGKEKLILVGGKSYINGPRLHEFLHEIYVDALSNYDTMTVGETVFSNLEDMKLLTGEKREELSMVFNFDHTNVDNYLGVKWLMRKFSLKRFKKTLGYYQKGLQDEGWNSLFYENHDQRRSPGRFGTDDNVYRVQSAKMLATSIYFLKGTPFIYEGQEIGMTNSDIQNIDDFVDVETHNIYGVMKKLHLPKKYIYKSLKNGTRDNARTPMQWDSSEYAGFSKNQPWLKVNSNKDYINVNDSYKDSNSIYNFYKKLIKLRKEESLVKDGKYEDMLPNSNKLFMYKRWNVDKELIIISNYSKQITKIPKKFDINNYKVILNNYDSFDRKVLLPYQAVVLKK